MTHTHHEREDRPRDARPGTRPRRTRRRHVPWAADRPRGARRALRREAPSTVAVLADETDLATMRGYRSFVPFPDHRAYLRQIEAVLRSLTAQGVHVRVAFFDPAAFADFCARRRIDPDQPTSRSRYVAEVAARGATVPYRGQPVDDLLPQLHAATERRDTWERATERLATVGRCRCCDQDLGALAVRRAARALTAALDAAGPGTHHLVCSVSTGDAPLLATLLVERGANDALRLAEADALLLSTVLAAGLATDSPGGVVLRTTAWRDTTPEVLRGWRLEHGWLTALTEAEVFAAYCTDPLTGEPIPPEPGVEYRAGLALPQPPDSHRPTAPG